MWRSREKRCSGTPCARRAPSQTNRSPAPRICSSLRPHQTYENFFQRTLRGMEIAEADATLAEIAEQGRYAGALCLCVIGVDEFASISRKGQIVRRKLLRYRFEPVVEVKRQLLLAELAHQFDLVLD